MAERLRHRSHHSILKMAKKLQLAQNHFQLGLLHFVYKERLGRGAWLDRKHLEANGCETPSPKEPEASHLSAFKGEKAHL